MKKTLTVICLTVILGYIYSAQTRFAGGGIREQFNKLDTNRDDTLSREEAGDQPFFTPADKNGDGILTYAEAEAYSRGDTPVTRITGMEGDGVGEKKMFVAPVPVPESISPVVLLRAKAIDGNEITAAMRVPMGKGPLPVYFWMHGGLSRYPDDKLRLQVTRNPVFTRMLKAGYIIVFSTFRTYEKDPQDEGPILDALGMIEAVKKLSAVDTNALFVCGGSGGGSIALEAGSRIVPSGIIVGEPATVIFTGMLTTGDMGTRFKIMEDPDAYYTDALRKRTRRKIDSIRSPILMFHGDVHPLKKLNLEIMVPALREAGVPVDVKIYKGMKHGFYDGNEAPLEVIESIVRDADSFMQRHGAKPSPMKGF